MTVAPSKPQPTNTSSQSVVLSGLSWKTYRQLTREIGDDRALRLTYDRGTLEIVMPSQLHEFLNRLLARIAIAIAEELHQSIEDFGSTRFDRELLQRGVEPDSCFYIQNADRVSGLDLEAIANIPPDLVIEIDLTRSSQHKLPVYASLQVRELWIYSSEAGITIYILDRDSETYSPSKNSLAFPQLTSFQLNEFLHQRENANTKTILNTVRVWANNQKNTP